MEYDSWPERNGNTLRVTPGRDASGHMHRPRVSAMGAPTVVTYADLSGLVGRVLTAV